MELGPRNDAAATRDNMARVLEARGDFMGAREMRLKGADQGHTMLRMCEYLLVPNSSNKEFQNWLLQEILLNVTYLPKLVRVPRRRHAVPPTAESLWCMPFCLLL